MEKRDGNAANKMSENTGWADGLAARHGCLDPDDSLYTDSQESEEDFRTRTARALASILTAGYIQALASEDGHTSNVSVVSHSHLLKAMSDLATDTSSKYLPYGGFKNQRFKVTGKGTPGQADFELSFQAVNETNMVCPPYHEIAKSLGKDEIVPDGMPESVFEELCGSSDISWTQPSSPKDAETQ